MFKMYMYTVINELDDSFGKKGLYSHPLNIPYTTLDNLHYLYNYGTTLGNCNAWIRIVKIPDDALVIDMQNDKIKKSDKLFLGKKYRLYDIETLKIFKSYLKITSEYINNVCILGKVNVLEFLKTHHLLLEYNYWAMDYASYYNHTTVLEWWKNSGLPLLYSKNAIRFAEQCNSKEALEWWKKSGLIKKYPVEELLKQFDVIKWWLHVK